MDELKINIVILLAAVIFLASASVSISRLTLVTPGQGDTILTGRTVHISWSGLQNGANASLQYSTDFGITWVSIASGITVSYFDWQMPFQDSLHIRFRVESTQFITHKLLWEINNAHTKEVRTAVISPDGRYALTAGGDNTARLWDMNSQAPAGQAVIDGSNIYSACFYKNSDTAIIACDSNYVIWDIVNSKIVFGKKIFGSVVRAIAVNPVKAQFALASYDSTVKVFDMGNPDPVKSIRLDNEIYTVRFSNNGGMLAFAGYKGSLYVYDLNSDTMQHIYSGHGQNGVNTVIWSADFSPDDQFVVTGGVDRTIRIWDRSAQALNNIFEPHSLHVRAVRWHPSGGMVMSGALDSTIRQRDIRSGLEVPDIINHGGQCLMADYSTGGDSIISCGRDRAVRLWKNFKYTTEIDSIDNIIRHPVSIKIPHLIAAVGDIVKVPIILEKNPALPDTMNPIGEGAAKLCLPSLLLENKTMGISGSETNPMDTISFKISNLVFGDTIKILKTLALHADTKTGSIPVLDFSFLNDSIYYIEKKDGSITLVEKCISRDKDGFDIGKSGPEIRISPNPAKDVIGIDLILVEDGEYKLEILDVRGELAAGLLKKEMKNGSYHFDFSVKDLPSGTYFVKLKTPNQFFSEQLIIIK